MDKKLTFTGGEPNLNWDDFNRDERSNRDFLFSLFSSFGYGPNDNFIISGCVATLDPGVDVSVTAGYIYLNGEILEVEAQTVVDGGTVDLYKYTKVVTYDPNGDKTYNDSTPRETWQKNRGVVFAATAPILSTELDVVDGDHFRNGAWQDPSFANSWAAAPLGFQFRIGIGGRLEFRGGINPAAASATTVFTLPVGYRPTNQKNLQGIVLDVADPHTTLNIDISAAGVVTVENTGSFAIYFDHITISLD